MIRCNVCGQITSEFGQTRILNKYLVKYYYCSECGFMQTEAPYWLDEAYSKAIAFNDVGLVQRNINFSAITKTMIKLFFDQDAKFLDYGGGYGLFVRIMRDYGLDFYRYDKYCDNIFANGFDLDLSLINHSFELVTAFELFEHVPKPMNEIKGITQHTGNVLFSTQLLPKYPPKLNEWWYYATESGQHISFYSAKTLQYIAQKFNLNICSAAGGFHLLTSKKINSRWLPLIQKKWFHAIVDHMVKTVPQTMKDYELLTRS